MLLKGVVVDVILLLTVGRASITDVTTFMFITAMGIQLIIAVESLPAEAALGVTLEATLIYRTRSVVARLFMLPQLGGCK